jgi:type II secretory pathway component PulM
VLPNGSPSTHHTSTRFIKEKLMVLVTGNWKVWLAGMAASLLIFAVLFFTVIKPSSDNANQALKTGMNQASQVLKQTQQDVNQATKAGNSVSSTGNKAAQSANKTLDKASKLASCVAAAGTDTSKIAACQSKYNG